MVGCNEPARRGPGRGALLVRGPRAAYTCELDSCAGCWVVKVRKHGSGAHGLVFSFTSDHRPGQGGKAWPGVFRGASLFGSGDPLLPGFECAEWFHTKFRWRRVEIVPPSDDGVQLSLASIAGPTLFGGRAWARYDGLPR